MLGDTTKKERHAELSTQSIVPCKRPSTLVTSSPPTLPEDGMDCSTDHHQPSPKRLLLMNKSAYIIKSALIINYGLHLNFVYAFKMLTIVLVY